MKPIYLRRTLLLAVLLLVQFSFANNTNPKKKKIKKNAKAQKVFVVLKGVKSNDSQMASYKELLSKQFENQGVDVNFVNASNVKDSEIFKQAFRSNSQYLILINQTHQYYIDGITNVGGTYNVMYFPLANGTSWINIGDVKMNIQVKASINYANKKIVTEFLDKL